MLLAAEGHRQAGEPARQAATDPGGALNGQERLVSLIRRLKGPRHVGIRLLARVRVRVLPDVSRQTVKGS